MAKYSYKYESDSESWSGTIALIIIIGLLVIYSYTQRFVEIDNNKAEQGIIYTATIDLSQYKNIGEGNGFFGKYSLYSRSDRHESIKIYRK